MAQVFDSITPALQAWLARQHVFFVATAPLAADGLVNCSPKGLDSFRVVGPRTVAYCDFTGSGIETVAHARENGRIVFLFCAFEGPPKIVRLHGTAQALQPGDAGFDALRGLFPPHDGVRALVRAELVRISDSCGFGVPQMRHEADRDVLPRYYVTKGPAVMDRMRTERNARSLDGLPGLGPAGDGR